MNTLLCSGRYARSRELTLRELVDLFRARYPGAVVSEATLGQLLEAVPFVPPVEAVRDRAEA